MIPALVERVLQVLAALLAVALLVTALHDVSRTWDVWYYHLPFAARIWGIVPAEAYVFHPTNQARFEGFPLFAELLQGLLWKLSGRPEAANLVALGALGLFLVHLARSYRVPLHLGALGLLAIPLVQLHATSAYVDLLGNLAASTVLFAVYRLYATTDAPSARELAVLLGAAAIAINSRFQLHPVVGLALLLAAPKVLGPLRRAPRRLAPVLAALPVVFAAPLKNLVVHHNPYYPMRLSIAGLTLPGPEHTYSNAPPYLASSPRPVRWIYSLLEIGIRPMSETRRWTIDQWMPEGSTGNRMGGFFGAYVVLHVGLLVYLAVRRPEARRPALAFAGLSVVASLLPQSHELRYYLFWMIVLVSLNLRLVAGDLSDARGGLAPKALGLACAAALAVVLGVTRAGYAYPSGATFAELVSEKVDPATLGKIQEGETVCLEREPFTILYASSFHPPRRYQVKETERPEGCGDHRWLE